MPLVTLMGVGHQEQQLGDDAQKAVGAEDNKELREQDKQDAAGTVAGRLVREHIQHS